MKSNKILCKAMQLKPALLELESLKLRKGDISSIEAVIRQLAESFQCDTIVSQNFTIPGKHIEKLISLFQELIKASQWRTCRLAWDVFLQFVHFSDEETCVRLNIKCMSEILQILDAISQIGCLPNVDFAVFLRDVCGFLLATLDAASCNPNDNLNNQRVLHLCSDDLEDEIPRLWLLTSVLLRIGGLKIPSESQLKNVDLSESSLICYSLIGAARCVADSFSVINKYLQKTDKERARNLQYGMANNEFFSAAMVRITEAILECPDAILQMALGELLWRICKRVDTKVVPAFIDTFQNLWPEGLAQLKAIPAELFDASFKTVFSPWNVSKNRYSLLVGISCNIQVINRTGKEILLDTTEGSAELNSFSFVFDKEIRASNDEAVFIEIPFWSCALFSGDSTNGSIEFVVSSEDLCEVSSCWNGPIRYETPPVESFQLSIILRGQDEIIQRIQSFLHANPYSEFLVSSRLHADSKTKSSLASTKDCLGTSWLSSQAHQLQQFSGKMMIENGVTSSPWETKGILKSSVASTKASYNERATKMENENVVTDSLPTAQRIPPKRVSFASTREQIMIQAESAPHETNLKVAMPFKSVAPPQKLKNSEDLEKPQDEINVDCKIQENKINNSIQASYGLSDDQQNTSNHSFEINPTQAIVISQTDDSKELFKILGIEVISPQLPKGKFRKKKDTSKKLFSRTTYNNGDTTAKIARKTVVRKTEVAQKKLSVECKRTMEKLVETAIPTDQNHEKKSLFQRISEAASPVQNSEAASLIQKESEERSSIQKESEERSSIQKESEERSSIQKGSGAPFPIQRDSETTCPIQRDSDALSVPKKEPQRRITRQKFTIRTKKIIKRSTKACTAVQSGINVVKKRKTSQRTEAPVTCCEKPETVSISPHILTACNQVSPLNESCRSTSGAFESTGTAPMLPEIKGIELLKRHPLLRGRQAQNTRSQIHGIETKEAKQAENDGVEPRKVCVGVSDIKEVSEINSNNSSVKRQEANNLKNHSRGLSNDSQFKDAGKTPLPRRKPPTSKRPVSPQNKVLDVRSETVLECHKHVQTECASSADSRNREVKKSEILQWNRNTPSPEYQRSYLTRRKKNEEQAKLLKTLSSLQENELVNPLGLPLLKRRKKTESLEREVAQEKNTTSGKCKSVRGVDAQKAGERKGCAQKVALRNIGAQKAVVQNVGDDRNVVAARDHADQEATSQNSTDQRSSVRRSAERDVYKKSQFFQPQSSFLEELLAIVEGEHDASERSNSCKNIIENVDGSVSRRVGASNYQTSTMKKPNRSTPPRIFVASESLDVAGTTTNTSDLSSLYSPSLSATPHQRRIPSVQRELDDLADLTTRPGTTRESSLRRKRNANRQECAALRAQQRQRSPSPATSTENGHNIAKKGGRPTKKHKAQKTKENEKSLFFGDLVKPISFGPLKVEEDECQRDLFLGFSPLQKKLQKEKKKVKQCRQFKKTENPMMLNEPEMSTALRLFLEQSPLSPEGKIRLLLEPKAGSSSSRIVTSPSDKYDWEALDSFYTADYNNDSFCSEESPSKQLTGPSKTSGKVRRTNKRNYSKIKDSTEEHRNSLMRNADIKDTSAQLLSLFEDSEDENSISALLLEIAKVLREKRKDAEAAVELGLDQERKKIKKDASKLQEALERKRRSLKAEHKKNLEDIKSKIKINADNLSNTVNTILMNLMESLQRLTRFNSRTPFLMVDNLVVQQQKELKELHSSVIGSLTTAEQELTNRSKNQKRPTTDTMAQLTELLNQLAN